MRIALQPDGRALTARITLEHLGFQPDRVWNPSPSVRHRTSPWRLPKTLRIGIMGNPDTGAKYSPPPFSVALLNIRQRALVTVAADPGYHLWNEVEFAADRAGVTVRVDLEGHSDPAAVAAHAYVDLAAGAEGQPLLALLAEGSRALYPAAFAPPPAPQPAWWLRPIYCGWGDQVTASMWLEGVGPEPRALAYATQGLYERWIRRLDQADVPVGTVTIDAGWAPAGTLRPHLDRWPDLKGFIRRRHQEGRKTLLWLATWLWDGLPDEWCIWADGVKLVADPTNPAYRRYLRERAAELVSPDGFDADGFKIDQLAYSPAEKRPRGGSMFGQTAFHPAPKSPLRLAGPGWGCELLYQLQKDIYEAAKAVKPDCLVTSSTVHPYFHDTFDMVRLHDMGYVAPDIFAAMDARADLAKAVLPHKPIDTDDWIHSDYDLWLRYTSGSRAIGVPCLFYAERFMLDWKKEPATQLVPLADLRRIAKAWRAAPPAEEAR